MKSVTLVITVLAAICGAIKSEDECSINIMKACSSYQMSEPSICNSRYGGIERIEPEVQAYINSNIIKSYEYLLMATHFNFHQMNRPGFQKLYQDLSDSSFDDSVEMIREISRRGGKANFNVVHDSPASVSRSQLKLEVDEIHSLAMALDTEKQLSNAVIHVHTRALHSPSDRDPEMAHYIEENILGKHAENVRKLNGYVNNLVQLMKRDDANMAVYMFDQYLKSPSICNSRYGGIEHIEPEVQAYINSNINKSYEYLLMATHFNSYQMHRPGFQKLYQGLSDSSFDDSIEMIREISRRGGKANFNVVHDGPASISSQKMYLEVNEIHSLALALDTEKQLSTGAFHVHNHALHSTERDPEMANYIKENILGKHSENVRKLNGYVNNLAQLMQKEDPSMAIYMFDQYLKKQ